MRIDGRACWLWALFLLIFPLRWLLAALLAAFVHELCHIVAVYLFGGKILSLEIGPFGAVIEAHGLNLFGECICALAGPAGSFLLVGFGHFLPMSAVCGLMQGAFNLLPVYPLDGGRAVSCIFYRVCPKYAASLQLAISCGMIVILFFLSAVFLRELLIAPVLLLLRSDILRKRP